MTNQQALIKALNDEFDDGGAGRDCWIHYHIACPYTMGDERAFCSDSGEDICRELCVQCKEKWLESEVDK